MSDCRTSRPSVTIAIPTFNGMAWLESSLHQFLEQDYSGTFDILLIDSGSSDGTDLLDKHDSKIKVHRIPSHEFGHGKTRNLATTLTDSELILLTVQDACPRNDHWISDMVEALLEKQLDAVCGGQAAPHRSDVNPLERYRPVSESQRVTAIDGATFSQWSKREQLQNCGWDNVNALYTRSALIEHAFDDVRFGEDMRWAKGWLESGGRIGYAYHCKVWHHHHHHGDYTRKRALNSMYWLWKTFNTAPPVPAKPSLWKGIQILKVLIWNCHIAHPRELWNWWLYNWTKTKNAASAGEEFRKALDQGNEHVDRLYESLGQSSPMATKSA